MLNFKLSYNNINYNFIKVHMNKFQKETDVVIIGAGPCGLFTVFELGILGLKSIVVDVLDKPGGQCSELYPEKPIYDIPAFPEITGQQLTDNLLKQIEPFDAEIILNEIVEEINEEQTDSGIKDMFVKTGTGMVIKCKSVVVAAGGGSFNPKKPGIDCLSDIEDKSVSYAVRNMEDYRDKNILIAGGGNSAIDWTMALGDVAKKVTLIHRRDKFRAHPASVDIVKKMAEDGKIDLIICDFDEISHENGVVDSINVKKSDGEIVRVDAQHILPFYGFTMKLGPVANFGLELHDNLIVVDTEKFETSRKQVFSIGDINYYPGKLKLILSGFHESALMAQQAFRYARPDEKLRFQYTTSSSEIKGMLGVK